MRLFIASLATETNTFAPFPTGLSGFEEYGVVKDASRSEDHIFGSAMRMFRKAAEAAGDEVIESLSAFAQPSGRTVKAVYERLRDEILADLAAAGTVDLVLLLLHGAMVADGCDDCEGDILSRIRAAVPGAVIGAVLDLHCHLTPAMIEAADVVIPVKEYPHIDFAERAADLFSICRRQAAGEVRPVAALLDTRMIGFYPTFDPPMRGVVDALKAAETRAPILTAGIGHGFPWGDVAEVGTKVLVYADGDGAAAATQAGAIARRLYDLRHQLLPAFPDLPASLDRARGLNGRTVLGDFSDNPGGGAPGDSTFFLRALVERRASETVIGCLHDPAVATICADAGVGARLRVRLGGKAGPSSGDPIDLEVEVMGVVENHSQGALGSRTPLGRSVWLRCDGIDIAVASIRSQVFEPDAFTGLGIDLDGKRMVVVKSSAHYQAGFQAGADHLWHVATPGALSLDFAAMPYTRRDGDYFPRIDDPWAALGEPVARIFHEVHSR